MGSRPGEFNISMNEGLSWADHKTVQCKTPDVPDVYAPDVYHCAIRGAEEELGEEN